MAHMSSISRSVCAISLGHRHKKDLQSPILEFLDIIYVA